MIQMRYFFKVLANARQLLLMTKGGNGVILSSGADEIIDLRAPYDAINMCILFGARREESRKFIAGNARKVLLRAESRKTVKGAMLISSVNEITSKLSDHQKELKKLLAIPEFNAQFEIANEEDTESINEDATNNVDSHPSESAQKSSEIPESQSPLDCS
ncbi:unnamed protein product [Anisakis simplex]|uniref:Ribonuclease P protein subunit p30 (inferred by orthology to a human protein) n=1 Tax=Anisakis simplex TaxID=6269 RepID=A0A0M3IZE4_ANISI|nr:unnamed protein product [Anisakis simplex]